jgi:hypothetical protein
MKERMFIMLKRSLLAAGLLGLAAGANAVSLVTPNATGATLTPQAIGAAGVVVEAKDFEVVVTDDIDLNGKSMQLDFSVAPVAALLPATLAVDPKAGGACADAVMADLTYAGITNDGKTVNYSISGDNSTPAGCEITVTDIHFAKGDLTTTGITVTSSFTIVGTGVSKSLSKTVIALGADQFKVTVGTKANEKIDVNDSRESYVGGAADTVVFTLADTATGVAAIDGVTFGTHEMTITGNFSWADNPLTAAFDPTTARQGQTPVAISGGATLDTVKTTSTSLVFDDTNNDGTYTLTMTPLTDANLTDADATNDVVAVAIPVQTFTVSTTAAYNDEAKAADGTAAVAAGTQVVAAVAAGAHSLNGASTTIFAVPFGPEIESHNIFISNSGTSTGAITGTLSYAGNTGVDFSLGNVVAGVQYLNIMAALEAIGEKPAFGRGDIALTVNSPEADITFTAGYTTATGRSNPFMTQQANIATVASSASTSAASALTQATTAATQSTTAATQSTTAATQSTAANTQGACTYAALGEGIDSANAGGTTAITENKYTKAGGC